MVCSQRALSDSLVVLVVEEPDVARLLPLARLGFHRCLLWNPPATLFSL